MAGRRHPVLRWLLVVVWACVIFAGSSIPGSKIPGGYSQIGHLGEYAILGALLYRALRTRLDRTRAIAVAVIVGSVFGITDEFHQQFVVLRTPDVADWALDTIGTLAGALLASLVGRFARAGRDSE